MRDSALCDWAAAMGPELFLFVDPRLFIQNHRSLMVSQFVSSPDLIDHDGIASAYIGTQIIVREGDSRARKGHALCVRMQFLRADKYPVHVKDNGLCSRHRLCPSYLV
jgi:hypothetical protein